VKIRKKAAAALRKEEQLAVGKGKSTTHHCWKCKKPPTKKYFDRGHLIKYAEHQRVYSRGETCQFCDRGEEQAAMRDVRAAKREGVVLMKLLREEEG